MEWYKLGGTIAAIILTFFGVYRSLRWFVRTEMQSFCSAKQEETARQRSKERRKLYESIEAVKLSQTSLESHLKGAHILNGGFSEILGVMQELKTELKELRDEQKQTQKSNQTDPDRGQVSTEV